MTLKTLCLPDLFEAYRSGLTPAVVLETIYRRIADIGDEGLFLDLIPLADVLADAEELGDFDREARPLWGVPFVVKDNIDVGGRPTSAGCREFAYTPDVDAVCVARLRATGALLIGKTNLDQFATGLVGVRTLGTAPRNAIDPALIPGGSSSGSAVAVAHGLASFALGTDTAGSGRVPAAFNNIVGLKPTLGRISSAGVVPACRSLDTVSIFALSCEDAETVLGIASGFDAGDPYSAEECDRRIVGLPEKPVIGIPDAASLSFLDDNAQAASYAHAIELIENVGASVREMDFAAFFEVAGMLYEGAWVAERYTIISGLLENNPDALHPTTRAIVAKAETFSAADVFRGMYRLQSLKRQALLAMAGIDAICVPSVPKLFRTEEVRAAPIEANSQLGLYTNFVNLLNLCGIAVPVGGRTDGLPGSVTLLGRAGADRSLAQFASRLHRAAGVELGATGWRLPDANAAPAMIGSDEIELAVVGAHMSGLPLNRELTRLGARYIRKTRTASCYRLFRLAGGPPERPGLVRDEAGRKIALETWALPSRSFGDFLKGVPEPLCIGTVTLETNERVAGFLCESAGLDGAIEITEFGGWRPFIASRQAVA